MIIKLRGGEVAEWSNALDLKSSVLRSTVGSNPTLSVLIVEVVAVNNLN